MRILFVSHYQLPHVGGIEFVVDELARALTRRGHEVAVVSSDSGGAAGVQAAPHRTLRVAAYNGLEDRLGVPYPLFSPRLLGVLRREVARADVVHAQGFLYQAPVAALALAGIGAHRPVRVLTEHVGHVRYESRVLDVTERAAILTLGRFAARSADAHVVYNATVGRLLARLAPGHPLSFILNGVDTDRFRPARDAAERERLRQSFGWDDTPRVLFAGRPVAKKGFDIAAAVAALGAGRFVLAVVGPDALPPGVPQDVELLGRLDTKRMQDAYRAADVLLVPSRGEGLPLVSQEALASGLPVVMSDDPGYRDTMVAGGAAVTLLPAEPRAMHAAVERLLAEPAVRAGAAVEAVEFARHAFSWPRAADEHEALYRRLGAP